MLYTLRSSDFAKSALFAPHGTMDLTLNTETASLYIEVEGPFNVECIKCFWACYDTLIESRNLPLIHANMYIARHNIVMSQTAAKLLMDKISLNATNGKAPVATAVVALGSVEGLNFMIPLLRKMFDSKRPFEVFKNVAEAQLWLDAEILKAQPVP